MKFYQKIQVLFLILIMSVLSACAAGLQKKDAGQNFKLNESNNKVTATQDNNISNLVDSDMASNIVVNGKVTKQPIFILSGNLDSTDTAYAQNICNRLNNDVLNKDYVCFPYPIDDQSMAKNYIRTGTSFLKPKKQVIADFMIANVNDIMFKQYNNSGKFANYPDLDIVMFLQGTYLYMFGEQSYNAIEFKRFVSSFVAKNPGKRINVGVVNEQARVLMTTLILSNNWNNVGFNFIDVDMDKANSSTKFDLIIDAGTKIDDSVQKFLNYNPGKYIPLSLDKTLIANAQKSNPQLSKEDISEYYTQYQLTSIVKELMKIEDENQAKDTAKDTDASDDKIVNDYTDQFYDVNKYAAKKMAQQEADTKAEQTEEQNTLPPLVNNKKFPDDYNQMVFGKSKFNFNIKSLRDILKSDKTESIAGVVVNTIGIKNVLVASRASDPQMVSRVMGSFLEDYMLTKSNLPTLDLQNSTIQDILLGGLDNNKLIYHYGVLNYPKYLSNNSVDNLSRAQAIIVNTIKNNLTQNSPASFGPTLPSSSQLEYISNETKHNTVIRSQERTIKNLNSVIINIQREMNGDDQDDQQNSSDLNTDNNSSSTTTATEPAVQSTPNNNAIDHAHNTLDTSSLMVPNVTAEDASKAPEAATSTNSSAAEAPAPASPLPNSNDNSKTPVTNNSDAPVTTNTTSTGANNDASVDNTSSNTTTNDTTNKDIPVANAAATDNTATTSTAQSN
ncbi:hypothetical protein ACFX5K_05505 [Rickettsiales bacterium LUAb2]